MSSPPRRDGQWLRTLARAVRVLDWVDERSYDDPGLVAAAEAFCREHGGRLRKFVETREAIYLALPHAAYLRTNEWQDLRAVALEYAGYACQVCNESRGLDVHHRTYERLGCERLGDVTVLCRKCHELFHQHGRLATVPASRQATTAGSSGTAGPGPRRFDPLGALGIGVVSESRQCDDEVEF